MSRTLSVLVLTFLVTSFDATGALHVSQMAYAQVTPPSTGRTSPYEGLPIRDVQITGLLRVDERLIRNQLRSATGQPYNQSLIDDFDVPNLTRLNQFRRVRVQAELTDDGGVIIIYDLVEWTLIADVQVTGNREIDDQTIRKAVRLQGGDPVDSYQINIAREAIEELYRKKGFFHVEVSTDPVELAEANIVLFKVREGPRVRIRGIDFAGNKAFKTKLLRSQVKTKKWAFLFRSGELDEEAIENDIRSIQTYYRNRGYLDVRVDRRIEVSNDLKEARLIFHVEENLLYTMSDVSVSGASRILNDQAAALMEIKRGDVYSQNKIRKSITAIEDFYGRLGFYGTTVDLDQIRVPGKAKVELVLHVREAELAYTGEIRVTGNDITQRRVIMREIMMRPDRPINAVSLAKSAQRLRGLNLFNLRNDPIQVLPPNEDDPLYRDIIVEVEEKNTAKLGFGAAVSSDSGLIGSIDFEQRNFDIMDTPESFSELTAGRAFRGAGQTFRITMQPGNEYSTYSIGLTEPYIFGTNNLASSSLSFTDRELESWDEKRFGPNLRLARRLGEFWVLTANARWQSIDLTDIDSNAPVDVYDVEGENVISGLKFGLSRSTYDHRIRPTRGSKIEFDIEQIGALGGDFDFTKFTAAHQVFFTIDEDFLGRKSILSMSTRVGYLFGGDSPTYERLYLGGRSFRGFDFRTVSPKGIQNNNGKVGDDPVGGDWLFFWGLEYEFPIFAKAINGVVFVDTGTVTDDVGFEDYRVTVGTGVRILIPAFGQAPLAFDLGIPLKTGPGDEKRILSFNVDVPF